LQAAEFGAALQPQPARHTYMSSAVLNKITATTRSTHVHVFRSS